MRVRDYSKRANHAIKLERQGAIAFNGGYQAWARWYFERSAHIDPERGMDIGSFYRAEALLEQELGASRPPCCTAREGDGNRRQFNYHWLSKHFYKRALLKYQHCAPLLNLLCDEYSHLAALTGRPGLRAHYQERAQYYSQAAGRWESNKNSLVAMEAAHAVLAEPVR